MITLRTAPRNPFYLESINQARNCLTHRRGIVETRDCQDGAELKICWLGMDMVVNTTSGDEFLLDLPLKEPVNLEEGGTVGVRFVERTISFGIGQLIEIEPKALAEICSYLTIEAKEFVRLAINFCITKGVQVLDSNIQQGKASNNGIQADAAEPRG